jgi:hypothetical protein
MRDFRVRWVRVLLPLLVAVACSVPRKVADCDPGAPNPTPCKNPLILVPGLGASVLDVRYGDA